VSGAELGQIAAATAYDDVVSVAADQGVIPVATGDRVIARATVEGELDEAGQAVSSADHIVAAIGMEDQILGRAEVEGEGSRRKTIEAHPRAIGRDREGLGPIAAIDLGGIGADAALEEVAAIAGVPDHAVVAVLAEDLVVAHSAGQHIVTRAAEEP